jgi:hypothetical protein
VTTARRAPLAVEPGERCTEAVVDTAAEGEDVPAARRDAGDVEAISVRQDRVVECEPWDARGRRVPSHRLLDGRRHQLGSCAQERPLLGVLGERWSMRLS